MRARQPQLMHKQTPHQTNPIKSNMEILVVACTCQQTLKTTRCFSVDFTMVSTVDYTVAFTMDFTVDSQKLVRGFHRGFLHGLFVSEMFKFEEKKSTCKIHKKIHSTQITGRKRKPQGYPHESPQETPLHPAGGGSWSAEASSWQKLARSRPGAGQGLVGGWLGTGWELAGG